MWFRKSRKANSVAARFMSPRLVKWFRPSLEMMEDRWVPAYGMLDPSFGLEGRVTTDFLNNTIPTGNLALAVQVDNGKTVVAGDSYVARYNADGNLDDSFGNGGRVTIDFVSTAAVAVLGNGSVVLAGKSYTNSGTGYDFAVARLTAAGQLDGAFGTGGKQTIDFGSEYDFGTCVAVSADGSVVVAGYSDQGGGTGADFAVARLTAAGQLDSVFGTGGKQTIDFGTSGDSLTSVALQADGKVVVAGSSFPYQGPNGTNFAVARLTAVGQLDTSFGADGRMTVDFGSYVTCTGVAVSEDGGVVMGGFESSQTGADFAVARLTSSGQLDATFGNGGKTTIDFGSPDDTAAGVALQADGKVIIAGYSLQSYTGFDFGVARLTAEGQLDGSFGTNGRMTIDFGIENDFGTGVAVHADGSVVVAGSTYRADTGPDFAVARLTATGQLDVSFSIDGKVTTDFPVGGNDFAGGSSAVAMAPGGKIVVAGTSMQAGTGNDFTVARYNADGSLDGSFGNGGRVTIDFGTTEDHGAGVAVMADGRVIVVGTTDLNQGTGADFAVIRLTASGQLDGTFSNDGWVTFDFSNSWDSATGVAIQTDGSVIVAGSTDLNQGTGADFAVVKLTKDGLIDTAFGTGGKQSFDFSYTTDYCNGVAVQLDGSIILAGYSYEFQQTGTGFDFTVAKLTSAGQLDGSFGSGGKQTIDFGSYLDYGYGLAVQTDGSIVLCGASYQDGTGYDFAIARLTIAGQLDDTFGNDGKQLFDFGFDDVGYGVVVDSDDGVVIVGYTGSPQSETGYDFAMARLTAAGHLDTNFGTDGKVITDFNSPDESAAGLVLQEDGKIVVAGYSSQSDTNYDFAVARYLGVNSPPSTQANGPYTITEGSGLLLTAAGSMDADGDPLTYSWDVNGDGIYGEATGVSPTLTWAQLVALGINDGPHTNAIKIRVSDGQFTTESAATTLTVKNVASTVGDIIAPLDSFLVGTSISTSASFTDPGTADTHTTVWDWGDGTTSAGTVTETNGSGLVTGSHAYSTPGVYIITLAVTDGQINGSGQLVYQSVVAFASTSIQGLVYVDFNNDGLVDFGEKAVAGVTVTLTGTDDLGNAVNRVVQTDTNGVYAFVELRPSNAAGYTITETQAVWLLDGRETLGTIDAAPSGNASVNDVFSGIVLHGGSVAENYNFGERPATTGGVGTGQTATIGYWQNKNGQNLIQALNGGATATQLGHWLAVSFPNMYANLDGMSNAGIAAFYKTLFARNGHTAQGGPPKMDAQILATALAVYVTNQTLAGTTAVAFGFQVTADGVGTKTFNVGNRGAAFGVANNSTVSVLDLLLAINARSHNGLLFDLNQDGQIDATESGLRTMASDVFIAINEMGGI